MDLKVLSDVDYGVAMSYGVLFRMPDETKAHYSGLGFDLGARHGSPVEMLPIPATYVIDARRPDPQRVRRARLHDTGGAGANPGLVAPGRFHVVVRKAEGGKRHQGQSDNELV